MASSIPNENRVQLINFNTQECCFICLKWFHEESGSNLKGGSKRTSLTRLFRYLGVNVRDSILESMDSSLFAKSEKYHITAEICSDCLQIISKVEELEKVVELSRMKISYQWNSIYEKVKDAENRTPSRMTHYRQRMNNDLYSLSSMAATEKLRERLLRKSKEMASKYQPRVVLWKTLPLNDTEHLKISENVGFGIKEENHFNLEVTEITDVTLANSISEINCKIEKEESMPSPCPSDIVTDPLLDTNFDTEHSAETDIFRKKEDDIIIPKVSFVCSNCGKILKNRKNLGIHIRNVHQKIYRFECNLCEKAFFFQSQLSNHKNSVHFKKRLRCNELGCTATFTRSDKLRVHQHSAHPEIHERYKIEKIARKIRCNQCKLCSRTFKYSSDLRKHHDNIHLGIRNFQCGLCDKKFFSRKDANRHRDSVHYNTQFPCDFPGCGHTTKLLIYLRKHQKLAHPEWYKRKTNSNPNDLTGNFEATLSEHYSVKQEHA